MPTEAALFFLGRLREARANALRDAEGFHDVIMVHEQPGLFRIRGQSNDLGLGDYKGILSYLASDLNTKLVNTVSTCDGICRTYELIYGQA